MEGRGWRGKMEGRGWRVEDGGEVIVMGAGEQGASRVAGGIEEGWWERGRLMLSSAMEGRPVGTGEHGVSGCVAPSA